jgi:hypothetical protein
MPTIRSHPLSAVKSLAAAEVAALKRAGIDNTKELLEVATSPSAEKSLAGEPACRRRWCARRSTAPTSST